MKTKIQRKQELLMQIHTILGVLWMQSQLETTFTVFSTDDCASEVDDRNISLREYLSELRKKDTQTIDIGRNPEAAYNYTESAKNAVRWAKGYLGLSAVALVTAVVVGYFHKRDGTGISYIFDFINIGGLVVSILGVIAFFISLHEARSFKVSKSSEHISDMWRHVRQHYTDVGFVGAAINQLLQDEVLAGVILRAETLPEQLRAGQALREIFEKHFVHVGVPYVKSTESGKRSNPTVSAQAKGKFDLMTLLVPFMGIIEHPGAVRTRAYDAARRKVQEEDETQKDEGMDDKDTEIIPFPSRTVRPKHPTAWDGPPPDDAA